MEVDMPSRTAIATGSACLLLAVAVTAAARTPRPELAADGSAGLHARYGTPVAMGNGHARTFILAQRSGPATAGAIALPSARRYAPAGFYPASYAIRWVEAAGEYRIALQGLRWRD
jgi:hypothetical protein